MELRETIQYGTMLYVILTLLVMPAAICNSQHMPLPWALPMVDDTAAPEYDTVVLEDDTATSVDDREYTELVQYFFPLQGDIEVDVPAGKSPMDCLVAALPFMVPY